MRSLFMVHSLDSIEKAIQLDFCRKTLPKLNVMVQVNTSHEENKHGVSEEKALEIAKFIVDNCWNLRFKGFMTIGSFTNSLNAEENEDFAKMIKLKQAAASILPPEVIEKLRLSMGMTNDYVIAIKMQSNYLRIGTAIFGERK